MVTGSGIYLLQIVDGSTGQFPLLICAFFEVFVLNYVYGYDKFAEDLELMLGKKPNWYWKVISGRGWFYFTFHCQISRFVGQSQSSFAGSTDLFFCVSSHIYDLKEVGLSATQIFGLRKMVDSDIFHHSWVHFHSFIHHSKRSLTHSKQREAHIGHNLALFPLWGLVILLPLPLSRLRGSIAPELLSSWSSRTVLSDSKILITMVMNIRIYTSSWAI